jgi:acyl dehydratase
MGWNRVRYPAPVPVDSKIRATAELVSAEEKGGGWLEIVDRFTIEVEGGEKPACVAESVVRLLPRTE